MVSRHWRRKSTYTDGAWAYVQKRYSENEELRLAHVTATIEAIRAQFHPKPLTDIEISLALGAYIPARGTPGPSAVNNWRSGLERPTDGTVFVLDALAKGTLALKKVGMDGRRRLFRVATWAEKVEQNHSNEDGSK